MCVCTLTESHGPAGELVALTRSMCARAKQETVAKDCHSNLTAECKSSVKTPKTPLAEIYYSIEYGMLINAISNGQNRLQNRFICHPYWEPSGG